MILQPLPVKPWRPRNEDERRAADRATGFFSTFLHHTKGKWARQPFNLLPWESEQVIRPLYGRLNRDGTRQFRRVWLEVGKKSGKSELAAGIALKGLLADDEPMAEVYIGAADKDQAARIFLAAARMVRLSPQLSKRCRILMSTKRILVVDGAQEGSFLEAIASDADSADGASPSHLIFDEVHRYKNREFYDTLIRSTAAREQPVVVNLTTAGWDVESMAWVEHEYARQVIEGRIDDPEMLAVIYAAKPGGDIRSPKYWQAANPSIGHTVQVSYFEQESRKALEDPANENSFRRFHGNEWVAQFSRWMPMDKWDASAGILQPPGIARALEKLPTWGGLDLSQTSDLTALVLIGAPTEQHPRFPVLCRFWIPEENVEKATRRDKVDYRRWVADGWLATTPGDTIDYATVERQVRIDALRYNIQSIAFDPTFAWQMAQQLTAAGILMEPVRQGFEAMAGPTADLLKLVKERGFEHASNPILRWMADNTVVEQDSIGRWRPSKRKAKKRIDGIVAAIMGLKVAYTALYGAPAEEEGGTVIYDDPVEISPHI